MINDDKSGFYTMLKPGKGLTAIQDIYDKTERGEMEPKDAGELGEHFKKLLELKQWIKEVVMRVSDDYLVQDIYDKLDKIIKEGKE